MKLSEITPASMRCLIGSCPAIYETGEDTYIIIGSKLKETVRNQLMSRKIGPGEQAVEIPKGLIDAIQRK